MPLVFRSMKQDTDGLPVMESNGRGLGLRPGIDITATRDDDVVRPERAACRSVSETPSICPGTDGHPHSKGRARIPSGYSISPISILSYPSALTRRILLATDFSNRHTLCLW